MRRVLLVCMLLALSAAHAHARATRGETVACPAACGMCPPVGFSGACCHGNKTCETQNWTPETCTPAFGTWCPASPSPPSPPTPSPPPTPPTPTPPRPPLRVVNYLIELGGLALAPLGSTHIILAFLEPSTPTIPPDNDLTWIKYAVGEFANSTQQTQKAILAALHISGTQLMASLGGSAAAHSIYSKYDPTAFGRRAAKYVVDLGLDGLDIDLEGWGNDQNGANFLKAVTLGAYTYFKSEGAGKKYTISHAPEMPDFWHQSLYAAVLADTTTFNMIDFVNVQMYNQLQFPSTDYIFTKDIYAPAIGAPTCLQSIAMAVANGSTVPTDWHAINNKLLLGFPCKDGSFPVGTANLNQCDRAQFEAVQYGVRELAFPLSGVFEWTSSTMSPSELVAWNAGMYAALKSAADH